MITSKRRRLCGATSFMSNLCRVQRSSRGPSGTWLSSSPITSGSFLVELARLDRAARHLAVGVVVGADDAQLDGDGEADVADHHDSREPRCEPPAGGVPARVVEPEALEHRPGAG